MPYIAQTDRKKVLETGIATNVGELNFLITVELHNYIKEHGLRYQHISDLNKFLMRTLSDITLNNQTTDKFFEIYKNKANHLTKDDFRISLQLAQQEFYRTVVAPYENQKALENGNISELDKDFFFTDHISFYDRQLVPGSTKKVTNKDINFDESDLLTKVR